jgi:hypothetical protein
VDIEVHDGAMSSVTSATINHSPVQVSIVAKKIPMNNHCTRDTTVAIKKKRTEAPLKKKQAYKIGFKQASTVFARGKQSALSVLTLIKEQFGVSISACTIQCQVKMEIVGTSPTIKGSKDTEFEKYVLGSVMPLYPHAWDKKGHRVLLKVDSGPGINLMLLSRLSRLEFVLYPGVPNTTYMSQEMDQQYGAFKMQFVTNLDTIIESRTMNGVGG